MRLRGFLFLFLTIMLLASIATAQMMKRTDVIWARMVPSGSITVDGRMDESVWAQAESVVIRYGDNSLIPTSGYRPEGGNNPPSDPLYAVVKFLATPDNHLYMGVFVRDSSVGGGLWAHFDAFLMNMRDRSKWDKRMPVPVFEYFYGWVAEPWADTTTKQRGASPGFFGWAGGRRTEGDSLSKIWYAVTSVLGVSNDDSTPDTGYVIEFRFNLTPRGYNVNKPEGEIIEFNFSIWDADWDWPPNPLKFSSNRTWWQAPWGNASWYNVIKIYVRPDVTTTSGPVPIIPADVVIPWARDFPVPTIDGNLNETVWADNMSTLKFRIAYGDTLLRLSYSANGPYRSGEFQPEIDGRKAPVLDPVDANVKMFFKGDTLYIGVDVKDQVITAVNEFDRWDGVGISITDRSKRNEDSVWYSRMLIVRIDSVTKQAKLDGYLPYLVDSLMGAKVGFKLKGTVNNPTDIDTGYTVELAIDLTKLGYPPGRGDGVVFIGVTLYDHDAFENPADNYSTRVWWFREGADPWNSCAPAWAYLDPNRLVVGVSETPNVLPTEFKIIAQYPNPFNPMTTLLYSLPSAGIVTLQVYDILGREVTNINIGEVQPGLNKYEFNASDLSSGVYFYRLNVRFHNGNTASTNFGKMVLIK